ncbi:HdeD family acid-resistance protein [Noviherbaspirillum suwonense]|uniref:Uncharacterized membrane protein HdeD, DUF308 family n=1 Tax=Noviherbaspirillum suwonense TaxID=1224511 RepID=A0ABY1QUZ8_9BURK|nr:HdeD family acid-resistance protein [Noviherbaspirillum suwonense]SMP81643.1 Uncharacterized membrane protein HdeD, DUF308 family [Noviherbaspirillum suwonense]
MTEMLARSWRLLAMRGVITIVFGVLALTWPALTLLAFAALFAAYTLLIGAVMVVGALKGRTSNEDWWLPLMVGLASLGAGAIAIIHPDLTALVLLFVIGANAMITGVLDIATAIGLRKTIRNEKLLILNGIASIAFGVLVFLFPTAGALTLGWLIGVFAMLSGILLLAFAFRLRAKIRGATSVEKNRRTMRDRRVSVFQP